MDVTQLKIFCRRFPGAAEKRHGAPYNILTYSVGGKNFAWFKTSEPEKWRFSFRVPPDLFLGLTGSPGIKPARYMGRFHWVTVVDVRRIPAATLREWVGWSYEKALSLLSQRKRSALLEGRGRTGSAPSISPR